MTMLPEWRGVFDRAPREIADERRIDVMEGTMSWRAPSFSVSRNCSSSHRQAALLK